MKTWFSIKALVAVAAAAAVSGVSAAPAAEISIYDEIGYWGVTGKDFVDAFNRIEGEGPVNLYINSPGGNVFDALLMFNAMKASGRVINVKIMGVAASAASYVAMVGNTIEMPENTFMMVHNTISGVYGHADDMREMADTLDKFDASLRNVYAKRTGMEPEAVAELLGKDSWLSAQECLDLKLCDSVTPAVEAQARFDLDRNLPANVLAVFNTARPAPAASPTTPFAEQVAARCKAVGLEEFTAVFALDPSITTADALNAAIADAREVRALCRVAGMPDSASAAITARKAVADVRAELIAARAAASDKVVIDTAPPAGAARENAPNPANTLSVNAFWRDQKARSKQ